MQIYQVNGNREKRKQFFFRVEIFIENRTINYNTISNTIKSKLVCVEHSIHLHTHTLFLPVPHKYADKFTLAYFTLSVYLSVLCSSSKYIWNRENKICSGFDSSFQYHITHRLVTFSSIRQSPIEWVSEQAAAAAAVVGRVINCKANKKRKHKSQTKINCNI